MPAWRSTQVLTIAAASAKFTNAMQPGQQYWFISTTDCWIKVTATGGAAAVGTADNIFVPANVYVPLQNPDFSGTTNSFVHAIQAASGGTGNLILQEGG